MGEKQAYKQAAQRYFRVAVGRYSGVGRNTQGLGIIVS